MDWQTVLSAVIGSSVGSAIVTGLFAHGNWLKQKRNEERLTIAKRTLDLTIRFEQIVIRDEKTLDWAMEIHSVASELSILLALATVTFNWKRTRELCSQYLGSAIAARENPSVVGDDPHIAEIRLALITHLFAEALRMPKRRMPTES